MHLLKQPATLLRTRSAGRRLTRALLLVLATLVLCSLFVETAIAKKSKSIRTEARWVQFDPAAKLVQAVVRKPGRGNPDKAVKSGKTVSWKVEPEGTVLTRTTVAINGRKAELGDIPEGKTVNIYWVPAEDGDGRFARKIDVIMSAEEWEAKFGVDGF